VVGGLTRTEPRQGGHPHPRRRASRKAIHQAAVSCRDPARATLAVMEHWSQIEAEQAFERAVRARRRAAFVDRLRRRCSERTRLRVHDERSIRVRGAAPRARVRDIPLDAISATLEPNRAAQFDREFRPAAPTRSRWQRVWLAEHQGAILPPISVVQVGDTFAVKDGHHRVSVAKARGALTITASVM
jgi:hypothetical protein